MHCTAKKVLNWDEKYHYRVLTTIVDPLQHRQNARLAWKRAETPSSLRMLTRLDRIEGGALSPPCAAPVLQGVCIDVPNDRKERACVNKRSNMTSVATSRTCNISCSYRGVPIISSESFRSISRKNKGKKKCQRQALVDSHYHTS